MKTFSCNALLSLLVTGLLLMACRPTERARVKGHIKGADQEAVVEFRMLDVNKEIVMDTLSLDANGAFSYRFSIKNMQSGFYYLYYNGHQIAAMVVKPGDAITVETTAAGSPCTFRGSQDSEDLAEANAQMRSSLHLFDSLAVRYGQAVASGRTEDAQNLNRAMAQVYIKQKQNALKFVMTHPYSLASVAVFYQQFSEQIPVFAEKTDYVVIHRICDSLEERYPRNLYVNALRKQAEALQNIADLERLAANLPEPVAHPELCLPDIRAQKRCLSELDGKVILLSFWYSQYVDMKLDNAELQEWYKELHNQGFEVYQVGIERDKAAWAQTVKEQGLPWISVCDGLGTSSPAVNSYQITELPTHFLLDREGNIIKRVAIDGELKTLIKAYLKR